MSTTVQLPKLSHATRKLVFSNLWQLVLTIPPPEGFNSWGTQSQHIKSWDDGSVNQPAIFLVRAHQTATQKHAYGVTGWHWRATIWIYYRIDGLQCAGDDDFPEELVDDILDKVEQVFETDPLLGPQTLGGTVVNCWIDGDIVFDSGVVDNQAVIIVPLSILI